MADNEDEIFVRAAPSGIHGVGVFAVSAIPQGAIVQLWSDEELRLIPKNCTGLLRQMVLTYGVETADGFLCPKDFNRVEIGWYINHSDTPNMTYANQISLRALRHLAPGEELTVNYEELEGEFHEPPEKYSNMLSQPR